MKNWFPYFRASNIPLNAHCLEVGIISPWGLPLDGCILSRSLSPGFQLVASGYCFHVSTGHTEFFPCVLVHCAHCSPH